MGGILAFGRLPPAGGSIGDARPELDHARRTPRAGAPAPAPREGFKWRCHSVRLCVTASAAGTTPAVAGGPGSIPDGAYKVKNM